MGRAYNFLGAAAAAAFIAGSSASIAQGGAASGRGLDPANLDPSCRACDDFFRYANGGWLDRTPIPESKSRWSSYDEVDQRTRAELKDILEKSAAAAAAGDVTSTKGKLGLFYSSCLNTERAAAEGVGPIKATLDRIGRLAGREDLQAEIIGLQMQGTDALFAFFPLPDPRNSKQTIGWTFQSGTTLPDITHYYAEDEAGQASRERLRAHVARMFELSGSPREAALADAERVVRMETELARASMTPVQLRDLKATTNRMKRSELASLMPSWKWDRYLAAAGAPANADLFNVAQPQYLKTVDAMLGQRPMEDWRAYLRWRVINGAAQWLSPAFADAQFAFTSSFSGAKVQEPRWEQCLGAANNYMMEAVGRQYTERVFTPQARARGLAIIHNLRTVLRERLKTLDWMSDSTRKEAIAKLDAMGYYVGGPSKWIDYSPLRLPRTSFVDQLAAASQFQIRLDNARIGKPVDPDRWDFPPQRASGAYDASRNRLVYPAAKFQPPFFDPLADDAVNYGAIGSTIGHEIGHGFDDEGRQFDAAGNIRDWWTPEDAKRFNVQADKLAAQFDNYTVNGDKVNGRLSLGENLADLGGLTISYYALQRALKGKPRTKIDGFTPEQRFFLSWAQNFRGQMRPERIKLQLKVGPHAPMHLRVLGPLSNMPEFAAAFSCKPGDKMVRSDGERVKVF